MNINILKMNKDEQDYVVDRLVEYNLSKVPAKQNELFIDLSKKVEYKGKIIAGIIARMYCWGCVYIDTHWVDEKYRNKNIGTQLLISVENEARIKDAHLIHLDTFDFQAKEFYLKVGYDVFGKLEDCPLNHIRYFMKKII